VTPGRPRRPPSPRRSGPGASWHDRMENAQKVAPARDGGGPCATRRRWRSALGSPSPSPANARRAGRRTRP
jgi:hypothetical protein